MNLPVMYAELDPQTRREVRAEYILLQDGKCHYCGTALAGKPADKVMAKPINWKLFPETFQQWPIHLHHSHDTGLTIGAVHMRCNAYLWQYEGE